MTNLSSESVIAWMGMKAGDANLDLIVLAVEAYIDSLPVVADSGGVWSAQVKMAGVMLAGRYHRRRNSPAGVEAITDGGVAYVARYDSDIARLLQLDGFQKPRVG